MGILKAVASGHSVKARFKLVRGVLRIDEECLNVVIGIGDRLVLWNFKLLRVSGTLKRIRMVEE